MQNEQNNIMEKKLEYLRKLRELEACGVHLSQHYDINSDLEPMIYEYYLQTKMRERQIFTHNVSTMAYGMTLLAKLFDENKTDKNKTDKNKTVKN
jgi:hypothetical protein